MGTNFLSRLGTFFILVGFLFLILFAGTILAREFSILYLFLTVASFIIGISLRRTAPPPEPKRFSSLRRVNEHFRKGRDGKNEDGQGENK